MIFTGPKPKDRQDLTGCRILPEIELQNHLQSGLMKASDHLFALCIRSLTPGIGCLWCEIISLLIAPVVQLRLVTNRGKCRHFCTLRFFPLFQKLVDRLKFHRCNTNTLQITDLFGGTRKGPRCRYTGGSMRGKTSHMHAVHHHLLKRYLWTGIPLPVELTRKYRLKL